MRFSTIFAVAIAVAVSFSVSGCGKSKQAREAEAAKKKVDAMTASLQLRTAQQLKDPASAQFLKVHLNTEKTALCGQINAKNSYGGYVGFRDFITTEEGVFMKPETCGTTSVFDMPPDVGIACMKYIQVLTTAKKCE
jgi:hypothetical protein